MAGVPSGNFYNKRGTGKPHAESLKAKNKELARALEIARKDMSQLFQENLGLKKERQDLLERVANLETRLSQLLSVHSTQQSLSEVLFEMEGKLTQAKSLLSFPPHNVSSSLIVSPFVHHPSSYGNQQQSTPIPSGDIAMETDDKLHCYHDVDAIYVMASASSTGIVSTQSDESRQRPRRACTSLIQSYQEPYLHSKLRRGDPFTDNSLLLTSPSKKKHIQKNLRQKAGLQDITNKLNQIT